MRIVVAQLNYKIGDFEGNFSKIAKVIKNAKQGDLIIFSELCLSGYYPKDLIDSKEFIQQQEQIFEKIKKLTQETKTTAIIGMITKNKDKGKPFFNSLCLLNEKETFFYHKKLLPMYDIFNEGRHFAPGSKRGIYHFQNYHFGFLICEDGWAGFDNFLYESDPVNEISQSPLQAIICINGSPSNVGKQQERSMRFSAIAKKCQAPLIFVNQVGGNDDIVFDGMSFVIDNQGNLLGSLKPFEEDIGLLNLQENQIEIISGFSSYAPLNNIELFFYQTLLGLKDYVNKNGFKQVVIGVSGGIDSALTLALAVKALGSKNVTGLIMPSRYSSPASEIDAKKLCDIFKVKYYLASIEKEFTFALQQFEHFFQTKPHSLTEQNMQARIRGRILMEYSNQTGALVLSTGNKSELSVGYTTLYGDMTGGFNLIGDLYKTDVYQLAHFFNLQNPQMKIPTEIIDKIPSAELLPNQKDTDSLPDYAILDPILKLYIEGDLLPPDEVNVYHQMLTHTPKELISNIHQMVNRAEFKRRQSAPIIRVQRRAFGFGRQLPIAATYPK